MVELEFVTDVELGSDIERVVVGASTQEEAPEYTDVYQTEVND